MRVPFIALAAFLLCFTACRRAADAANLATVDSLLLVTDTVIASVDAIDTAALRALDVSYKAKLPAMEAMLADTLDKQALIVLVNYRRAMTKTFGRATNDQAQVRKELAYTRQQLLDLRHDVEESAHEPAVEHGFLSQEALAVNKVRDRAMIMVGSAKAAQIYADLYGAQVDSLLAITDTLR